MTEHEALIHFGKSEPDSNDPAWQAWHDEHLKALALSRSLTPISELTPTFTVQVELDGDDSAEEATDNVLSALRAEMKRLVASGQIVDGGVT